MAILVLAEHDNRVIKTATLNAIAAAKRIGGEVHLLVSGGNCGEVAKQAARIVGVARVLQSEAAHFEAQLAESVAALVAANAQGYDHILASATSFGKNVLPRVAALLDVAQISDIVSVEAPDTFVRPIFAGNALATVRSSDLVKVISVRSTAFEAAVIGDDSCPCPIETLAAVPEAAGTRLVDRVLTKSDRPELGAARIIVSGGRGLGSGENYRALLEPIADTLGAALGASRAAVDAGFVPNDYQVGQTGKIVAPELYLAVGISGAIQHLAGMKDSKVIVAINKDPEAPIFQVADYGLVADLFAALPELVEALH